ncbi:MAG: 1-deoxy-D-xylulose-5-phosphate synthase [Clostridiales bacterium]|nr:1-deoxy-D-xylulose-5-phosphate synthase [Clostridiales bacterium]
MSVLSNLNNPSDIKKLNISELKLLSNELREKIIQTTSKNGGHLSSNLGIIETTVALYHVFDFPKDKLIFDVGHQCYAHKILSGRRDQFDNIRLDGGISGFPSIEESEYDAFGTGHAGTSIPAGLGYCIARDKNNQDYSVINVVGDGSIVNGLNLEAISMSNHKPRNYLVILNDNGMSISKNVNGFYRHLTKTTTNRGYIGSKRALKKIFGNSFVTRGLVGIRNFFKRVFNNGQNYFEDHGFKYVGVVDGNNLKELVAILQRVKNALKEKAVILHIKTTKGKGFSRAEEHSDVYHGVSANLNTESGDFAKTLGKKLNEIIDKDKKVVAITAGMKIGTGLNQVEKEHKENFFDSGIAEEFAVTNAAGMAVGGLKPVVAIYSTFLQRGYDQIVHDVCLQNLPVIFCIDRAGLVGSDGKTHQGVFDLSYLSHLPNLSVLAPSTTAELEDMLEYALEKGSPFAIRYPKNSVFSRPVLSMKESLWETLKEGTDVYILAVGPNMVNLALKYASLDEKVGVINARSIKPIDKGMLNKISDKLVITIEENSIIGGFGSLVNSYYAKQSVCANVINLGVKDQFVEHGLIISQYEKNGLTIENISEIVKSFRGRHEKVV